MEKKLALPQQAFLGCFIASFALALSLSLQASIGFVAASLLGFVIANIALALSWQASHGDVSVQLGFFFMAILLHWLCHCKLS